MWTFDEHTAWSLGRFKPELTHPAQVRKALRAFLLERVSGVGALHVRDPDHEWSIHTMQGLWRPGLDNQFCWHRDSHKVGEQIEVNPGYLLTWANKEPTQFRSVFRRGIVYEARPWELTVLDNYWVEHRAPKLPKYRADGRWFIRTDFPRAGTVKDVAGVHQLTL